MWSLCISAVLKITEEAPTDLADILKMEIKHEKQHQESKSKEEEEAEDTEVHLAGPSHTCLVNKFGGRMANRCLCCVYV